MLLGQSRGKVGSLVFSRVNGKQIVRSRPEVVKNPQTEKQMMQRIIMNTIMQAYARFAAITDHSFEGVQQGQASMSKFMRDNLKSLRTAITNGINEGYGLESIFAFVPVGQNGFAANEYIIAAGRLPQVDVSFDSTYQAAVACDTSTYGSVISSLGLQRGDQLTFCIVNGTDYKTARFNYVRVILDPVDGAGESLSLDTPFIVDGAINKPNPRNEGTLALLSGTAAKMVFNAEERENNHVAIQCAGVIVSRQSTDGSWLRSNTVMKQNDVAIAGIQLSMQECLDLLTDGGVSTLSRLYLNNAGVRRLASANGSGAITVNTVGGNSVALVSLAQMASGVPAAVAGAPAEITMAVDSDGNAHPIICMNEHVTAYEKYLADPTAATLTDAWKEVASSDASNADWKSNAVILWDESASTSQQEGVKWLTSKGVAWSAFMGEN